MPGSTVTRPYPDAWSVAHGFDQAQLRPAPRQLLTIAGQGSLDESGQLLHEGDLPAQVALSVANLEGVLAAAGMDLGDVVQLTVHAVDVDGVLGAYDVVRERLALAGATPPTSVIGVTRLALPGMLVQLDALAAR